jgi:hypothetical protein
MRFVFGAKKEVYIIDRDTRDNTFGRIMQKYGVFSHVLSCFDINIVSNYLKLRNLAGKI